MARPDPWALLRSVQTEEKRHRGSLKIFFGYAAGVGKTYAMLNAAQTLRKSGVDVVAGYVEPHARAETMALLAGLEQLPTREISYKGMTLQEFDLDAALARQPQVILVDELAHTNGAGCRHAKRYLDVEELLDQGIDVLTTVNVQHLESLNDMVAAITQVQVAERIPDRIFDQADQVELVDIEPEELLARLSAGKIYQPEQAERAQANFFTKDKLAALREIALRRMADRVNERVEGSRTLAGGQYYTEEHILICLSPSPSNSRVIRAAARLNSAFKGAFTALYVETPQMAELGSADRERLDGNIKLAEQLGARVTTVHAQDLAKAIAEYAVLSGVSKVVLGRSNNKRRWLGGAPNLADNLVALAPELDLYIIPDKQPAYDRRPVRRALLARQLTWQRNGLFVLLLLAAVLLGYGFEALGFPRSTIIMSFILGAFLTAFWSGSWLYGAIAPVIYILAFNFFFTQPRFTLWIHDAGDLVTCAVLIITTLLTSSMTIKIKEQSRLSAREARRTEVLLETSQKLQRAMMQSEIIQAACGQFVRLLECSVAFYPVGEAGLEQPKAFWYQDQPAEALLSADGQAVAAWAAKSNKPAGRSTDTLSGAKGLYLPIASGEQVLAVLAVDIAQSRRLQPLERGLLTAMLNETAFALEKHLLGERQKQAQLEADRERLRANLLRAISHDLRTPLTSISADAAMLLRDGAALPAETARKLLEDIGDDAGWLINLVENLLSVTRLDNGEMTLHLTVELVADVVAEALKHISRQSSQHKLSVRVDDEWLIARMDAQLIVQVITNLVNNAIAYTQPGSTIVVSVSAGDHLAVVEVADDGDGISAEDKARLFDLFFTGNQSRSDSRRGLGIGLSLCQSIIKAHGGTIYVRDNKPRGTIAGFTLPAEEVGSIEADHIGR